VVVSKNKLVVDDGDVVTSLLSNKYINYLS